MDNKLKGSRQPCSRRKFCPFCAWTDGQNRVKRYLCSFDPATMHGITVSWSFRGDVGFDFRRYVDYELVMHLQDCVRDCSKALASRGGTLLASY